MRKSILTLQKIAGKRYEKHIAIMLQKQGWEVTSRTAYTIYDRGIDMTATRDGRVRYIQCKGWRGHSQIREDVVDQLFGSVAYCVGTDEVKNVEIYLYSSVRLSPYAEDHAKKLGVHYFHEPFPYFKNSFSLRFFKR